MSRTWARAQSGHSQRWPPRSSRSLTQVRAVSWSDSRGRPHQLHDGVGWLVTRP